MKRKIALVTGGYTGEFPISIKTSETVYENIDKKKFQVYVIVITKQEWYYVDDAGNKQLVDKNDFSIIVDDEKVNFDVAFIVMHGSPGEDGRLAAYFEMLDIPFTGCGVLSSAITMNKAVTKKLVMDVPNLNVAKSYRAVNSDETTIAHISSNLRLPLILKPNNGGSSIGMTKVESYGQIKGALDKLLKQDREILVEEFISGREFSVGIFRGEDGIEVLPSTEIVIDGGIFDYETKYFNDKLKALTPGRLSDIEVKQVESIAKSVYEVLECDGIVRMDYFIEYDTGAFYFIEMNTIPGQTDHSFIPKQVAAANLSLTKVYTDILENAIIKAANNTEPLLIG